MAHLLGVDIGGTKIASAIIHETGQLSSRSEVASLKPDGETLFGQVIQCMEETLQKSGLTVTELEGIGLGVPGKVDHENGLAVFQNNLPWSNFPLVQRVKEHFHAHNVVVDNDVHMAGFAEWVLGGMDRDETFVYLTISTGISCCTIHKGDFIRGAGFAGEIGFLPVQMGTSGDFDRLEPAASGPGIEKAANQFGRIGSATTAQVVEAYMKAESAAVEVMNGVLAAYAQAIYATACLLDPDALVLGGGVINHHPELLDGIKAELEQYLVENQRGLLERMRVSEAKGDSGLVGAGLRVHRFTK